MKVLISKKPAGPTLAFLDFVAADIARGMGIPAAYMQPPIEIEAAQPRIAGGALHNAIANGQIKTRIPIASNRPNCFQ